MRRGVIEIARHRLGMRLHLLGLRVHEWHLGRSLTRRSRAGALLDRVDLMLAAGVPAAGGGWLLAAVLF
ncbi:MAG: hypothetical protein E6G13_00600 [Actinobacteria bacterium]|nr:MAG: hypothetical protein E6G13_00600 [Actinomycetota bacterium]